MKIRNIKDYRDKQTKKIQKAGDIRDVADGRGKEIIKKGYAEIVAEPESAAAPEQTT